MANQAMTRSQLLVTLRHWLPNASLRRLGDLVDSANVVTLEKPAPDKQTVPAKVPLAFGVVLQGTLRVTIEGEGTRWVRPGDIFGMTRYQTTRQDALASLVCATPTVQILSFTMNDVSGFGYVRAQPTSG